MLSVISLKHQEHTIVPKSHYRDVLLLGSVVASVRESI